MQVGWGTAKEASPDKYINPIGDEEILRGTGNQFNASYIYTEAEAYLGMRPIR